MMTEAPASMTTEIVAWAFLTALAVGGFCWAALRGQFTGLDHAARLPLATHEDQPGPPGTSQGSSTRTR